VRGTASHAPKRYRPRVGRPQLTCVMDVVVECDVVAGLERLAVATHERHTAAADVVDIAASGHETPKWE